MSGWRHKGEMQERLDAMRDAAATTTGCAFCPGWSVTGTAAECREASLDHRRKCHPDRVVYVRPRRAKRVEQTAADRKLVETLAGRGRSLPAVSRRRLTDDQLAAAARRYDAGESVRSIARQHFAEWGYGSVETLAVALYRSLPEKVERWRGREQKRRREGGLRLTEARVDAVEMLYAAKWSLGQIAVLVTERWGFPSLGACRNELSRALKARGVRMRRRGVVTDLPEMGRAAATATIERADGEQAGREPVFRGERHRELAFRGELVEIA